jgi:ribonuclease T2
MWACKMPFSRLRHAQGLCAAALVACLLAPVCALPVKYARGAAAGGLGFDYVHLVQEWPGSFCDTKKGCLWPKDEPTTGFLLHGLWPEFFNGSWPEYCDASSPFNMTALSDLVDDLHTYWPSLVAPDQSAFWAHEWTRHGTCMEPYFKTSLAPEHDYFALVLKLREEFDAYKVLGSKGVVVGSVTTWEQVKLALEGKGGFPKKVEIGCNLDKLGTRQLLEVRTCYAALGGGLVAIDCPNEASATECGSPKAPIAIPLFHPPASPSASSLGTKA